MTHDKGRLTAGDPLKTDSVANGTLPDLRELAIIRKAVEEVLRPISARRCPEYSVVEALCGLPTIASTYLCI
jgi:hypothetical protein